MLIRGRVTGPLRLADGAVATPIDRRGAGVWAVEIALPPGDADLYAFLDRHGEVPLPPYISKRRGKPADAADRERYQTVYAKVVGSAAAPTAGLHFTSALLDDLRLLGVQTATITLHIGLDTFRTIQAARLEEHSMHRERFFVPPEAAAAIRATHKRGGRVVAVGTTVVRALESHAKPDGAIDAGEGNAGTDDANMGETDLFITPGFRFSAVDALITNFHLPKSTLLVLVSAFAGREAIRTLYEEAIRNRYRFFSYGDAMLIL